MLGTNGAAMGLPVAGSGANPSDRHDVDNAYTCTNRDADDTDGDGTMFTDFLADLNSSGGFAGSSEWRLPTIAGDAAPSDAAERVGGLAPGRPDGQKEL